MKLILYLIGRLIVICFALFVALLAGSLFVGFGIASGMLSELLGPELRADLSQSDVGDVIIGGATFVAAFFASINLAGSTVLPVTIAVAISELMRWQSMTVHLVLGGLCALFVMFTVLSLPEGRLPANGTVIVSLAAGFVAAFFYWLIAGRNSGEWLSALGEQNPDRES
jgi:hypothetical protein